MGERTAHEAIAHENLLRFDAIDSLQKLEEVLKANHQELMQDIQRLALSAKPEDNYKRLKALGKIELIINLLSRTKKSQA